MSTTPTATRAPARHHRVVDSPAGPLLLVDGDAGLQRIAFAAEDHDRDRALPPDRPQRRHGRALPRRRGGQADAARPRSRCMSPASGHRYTLLGPDAHPYRSATPGMLGGHRRSRIYGRLDCPSAARAIARGHYVAHRVFFADEPTAVAAGYRPCAVCLPDRYAAWKRCNRWCASSAAAW
jgi:hypothetical protein